MVEVAGHERPVDDVQDALERPVGGLAQQLVDFRDAGIALGDEAEIDRLLRAAADGPLKGILNICDGPLVSSDFNHDPASSTYDPSLTKVIGRNVKVCAWYDNEWGFSNRMLDTSVALSKAG